MEVTSENVAKKRVKKTEEREESWNTILFVYRTGNRHLYAHVANRICTGISICIFV